MVKIASLSLFIVFLLTAVSYGQDAALFDLRGSIYEESMDIKKLVFETKDPVLISSMWDASLITITQLDAYFHMINIFNTIRKEDLNDKTLDSLIEWLITIKATNNLNIKTLSERVKINEPSTETHIRKLKTLFETLSKDIDLELDRVSAIKSSLKLR